MGRNMESPSKSIEYIEFQMLTTKSPPDSEDKNFLPEYGKGGL